MKTEMKDFGSQKILPRPFDPFSRKIFPNTFSVKGPRFTPSMTEEVRIQREKDLAKQAKKHKAVDEALAKEALITEESR